MNSGSQSLLTLPQWVYVQLLRFRLNSTAVNLMISDNLIKILFNLLRPKTFTLAIGYNIDLNFFGSLDKCKFKNAFKNIIIFSL